MRERMIEETRPNAMVCIGGMEGVIDEARLFRRGFPDAPIFVLSRTGGAAAILAEDPEFGTQAIDEIVARDLDERRSKLPFAEAEAEHADKDEDAHEDEGEPASPYPLIMQTVVESLRPEPKDGLHG